MKNARKALPLKTIAVKHPVHGTYIADGVKDKLQAVQRAAKVWNRQWSDLAKECTFREVRTGAVDGAG